MSVARKMAWTFFGVVVVAAAALGVAYYRLSPVRHFHPKDVVIPQTTNREKTPTSAPGTVNVLVLGSDARPGDVASHTDSILLCHLNFKTHTYNVLSVPRDSRAYDPGVGYTKMTNVQYMGQTGGNVQKGVLDAVQAVSNLTGVPIDYYAETDYWGLQDLVNSVGTIQMHIPFKETLTHPWYSQNVGKVFLPGTYTLDGEMVSEVVHERDSLPEGDYSRQQLQEEAMIGLAKALLKPINLPKLPAFFRSVPKFLIGTNFSTEDMMSLALAGRSFSPNQVHYYQAPGTPETLYDDALDADNDQIVLDQNALEQIIQEHFTS